MPSDVEASRSRLPPVDPSLAGIGGWLILPAIGLSVGPIASIAMWIYALSLFAVVSDAGYGAVYSLELVAQAGLTALMLYAAVCFFGKKRNAPSVIIALLAMSVAVNIVLMLVEFGAYAEIFAIESGKQVLKSGISAAIWIPYFRVSRRVRATFIA